MKKILKYILVNIIVLIILIFILDFFLFVFAKYSNNAYSASKFSYMYKNPLISYEDIYSFFDVEKDNPDKGRLPEGLEYGTSPIVIFGCSFAYGEGLEQSQTFGHKLSVLMKRPVYNRAVSGQSFQEMYFQSENPVFYEQVPDFDTVIYVIFYDSYRRMYDYTCEYMDTNVLLHYNINKNNELVYEHYSNAVLNFLKSLYIVKFFFNKYYSDFVNDNKNAQKITDDAMLYLIKSRDNFEKHLNHKVNFYVLFYSDFLYQDILRDKLYNNGFKTIETMQLTDENLASQKYQIKDDGHPNEAAWDLLTPLIAKKIYQFENY